MALLRRQAGRVFGGATESFGYALTSDVRGGFDPKVFIIAIGSVSKILIKHMFEENPNNTYIDIGSLIDGLIGNASRA
eukprot:4642285-Pyramimonas_sp.AAC.2